MKTRTNPKIVLGVYFLEAEARGTPSASKVYHYFVPDYITHEFKPQDMAIVRGAHERMALVRVEEVLLDPPNHWATKDIIGTVDVSGFRRERERTKRRAEVIAALQRLDEQRLERARFAELAKGDQEAARLVQELEQLDAA